MDDARTRGSASYLSEPQIHEQWESDYLNPDMEAFYEASFDAIVRRLGVPEGTTLLDAGCGYCLHAVRYVQRGLKVTGVDFSSSALDAAKKYLASVGLEDRVELVQGDLLALPFADAKFGVVSCWGVLMHIPQVDRALAELVRVLRPGGKLVLMENNADSVHVQVVEPIVRMAKRLLGRKIPPRERTKFGVEDWIAQDDGGLMVRKIDAEWLEGYLGDLGCRQVDRFTGQLTELYTSLSPRPLKKLVYRTNMAFVRHGGNPRYAMGNIFVFEKR